jgi:hypothetical protein
MGYIFLWLEAMASALLLVAGVFSFSGRLKKWPTLWPFLMALLLTLPAIVATVFAGYLFFENIHPQWLFPYTFSWTLLFVTGSWILIRWGRIKAGETLVAASWSRSKIAGAFVIALALQWSTMTALDNTAKLEATADQTMAIAKARTVLPPPPPYDQNAAALYDQAAEMLNPNQELEEDPDRTLGNSIDPSFNPKSEPAQKLLRKNKSTIDLINKAAQKPRLYHPYTLDFETIVFPRFLNFKYAAKLLALEARSHSRNGHNPAAMKNIYMIDKIAEQVNQSPLLINVLISISVQNISNRILEIILAENSSRKKIKISLPVKTHDNMMQAFKDGMTSEESLGSFSLANWVTSDRPVEFGALGSDELSEFWLSEDGLLTHFFSNMYRIFLFHDDRVSRMRYWEEFHGYIKEPYYKSGKNLKEWEKSLSENLDLGLSMAVNSYSMSSYFERVNNAQTQFLLARLGLAAAAYHSDHGKYPATLHALVPKYIMEIPIDPFSGEPLKLKAVKNGLILYGIGPNLKDNQGAPFERDDYDWDNSKGDIAFYLGSAFKEYRLKPALEAMKQQEKE